MLPFLKKDKEASVSMPAEVLKREPDEEPEYDSLNAAAEDLMHALASKDIGAIANALRSAFELCDSQSHAEGPSV